MAQQPQQQAKVKVTPEMMAKMLAATEASQGNKPVMVCRAWLAVHADFYIDLTFTVSRLI